MAFFGGLIKSLYDIRWLKLQTNNPRAAWGYFALLIAIVTVVMFGLSAVHSVPLLQAQRDSVIKKIPEFSATFSSGTLAVTGFSQPFRYTVGGEKQVVIIVNTTATTSVSLASELKNNESGVLITHDAIELFDVDSGQSKTQYWKNIPDTSFNRMDVVNTLNKFFRWPYSAIFLVIGIAALFIGLFIGKLILLLVVTSIVYIVARGASRPWAWSQLFTVGLRAVTLPLALELVFRWMGNSFGSIFFITLLAFMLALVLTKDEPVVPVVQ